MGLKEVSFKREESMCYSTMRTMGLVVMSTLITDQVSHTIEAGTMT